MTQRRTFMRLAAGAAAGALLLAGCGDSDHTPITPAAGQSVPEASAPAVPVPTTTTTAPKPKPKPKKAKPRPKKAKPKPKKAKPKPKKPKPTSKPKPKPAPTKAAAPAAHPLAIAADPKGQLKFTKSTLATTAGTVDVGFTNASPVPHNVHFRRAGKTVGGTPTFSKGKKSFSVKLQPGTYKYYCSVPGHEAAGMKGTLTVK